MEKAALAMQELMWTDRMHRAVFDEKLKRLGIRRNQHMLLMFLSHQTEPPTQVEIARKFNITSASVAGMLDKLEAGGFLERTEVKTDHRSKQIVITPLGREIVRKTHLMFTEVDTAMCEGIGEEELDALRACLAKLRNNLEKCTPDIHMKDNQ